MTPVACERDPFRTPASPPHHYLTVTQLVTATGLSPKIVYTAIRHGHLRAVKPRGVRRHLVPKDALDEWLQPVEPTPAPAPSPSVPTRVGSARSSGPGSLARL
jgi:excisionase family DNA binding protein